METKKIMTTGILAFLLSLSGIIQAQDSIRIRPFHLSFITPLGTNGLQSWNTVNRISVNLFAGYSGGLQGVELAGFANALNGDMEGMQVAGFCNNTFGTVNGIEVAGFWNFNRGQVNGLLLAGFANVSMGRVAGIQGAGFSNYSRGSSSGQLSGFANISTCDAAGIQGSGFANVTHGDMKGVQAAGFANVTTGTHQGAQAAGFFNYSHKLRGVQLGFVNVADTVEKGIPIGFLSFARNGYRVIQIGGNETLYGEISFKTGVRQFYNILSVGAASGRGNLKWGFGYGIGTLIPVGKRLDLSIEGVSWQIGGGHWFMDHLNLLNRLNLSLCLNFTRAIGVYAGFSWNVQVEDTEITKEWKHYHPHAVVSMYPGFNAGIRISL